jgi:hypothetical protein
MSEQAAAQQVRQPATPAAPTRTRGVLQRACACGKHTTDQNGECTECRKKRLGLQRRAVGSGPDVAPPIVHEVLRSPGRPLDDVTRGFMESRFNHDFSGVRVHTDSMAAQSAKEVGALAYTVGSHITFGANSYTPGSQLGRSLIAHELTHVVQQGTTDAASGSLRIENSPKFEAQADMMARNIYQAQGSKPPIVNLPSPAIQRQPKLLQNDFQTHLSEAEKTHRYWTSELSKETSSVPTDLKDVFAIVQQQGVDIGDDIEIVRETLPFFVSLSEEARLTLIKGLETQLQIFAINVEHLSFIRFEASFQVPDLISNKDEVEELLDDYIDVHEFLIQQNLSIAEVASDAVEYAATIDTSSVPEPNVEILVYWVANDMLQKQMKALEATKRQLKDIRAKIKFRQKFETEGKILELLADLAEEYALKKIGLGKLGKAGITPKKVKRLTKLQRTQRKTTRRKDIKQRVEAKQQRRKKRKEKKEKKRKCGGASGPCPRWRPRLTQKNPYWNLVYAHRRKENLLQRKHFNLNIAVLVLKGAPPIIEASEQAFHSEQLIAWKLKAELPAITRVGSTCPILGLFSERKPCTKVCQPQVLPELCRMNQGVPFDVYYATEYYDDPRGLKTHNNPSSVLKSYVGAGYDVRSP